MEGPRYFDICITVLEANDLPYSNISSLTCIEVGKMTKCTKVVGNTANPFYNEYFVFELHVTFSILMSTCISFKVYEAKKVVRRLVGSIDMEVATIWAQRDHRLKTWLAITIPSDTLIRVKGYLNCEIVIKATGDNSSFPKISTWIMPEILGRRRARYMVSLYECVGLQNKGVDKIPEVSVKILFARKTGRTTTRLLAETIMWNEQITFIELYPPLFQKMAIDLCAGKKILASKSFYLANIASGSHDGYLPTFGPTYVHLYVDEYVYCASLNLSIEAEYATILKPKETTQRVTMKSLKPIKKEKYGHKETFLCYGVLFDALLMDATLAQPHVSINMSLGFGCSSIEPNEESKEFSNLTDTPKYVPEIGNANFVYLPINENKPCVFVQSEWPDTHFRLINSNIVAKVLSNLINGINLARDLIAKGQEDEARTTIEKCIKGFDVAHNIINGQILNGVTPLDVERVKLLTNVLKKISLFHVRECSLEDLLAKCDPFITILDALCEDIQEPLPSVLMSFKQGKKVIGYCKLHPREIFFSKSELSRGDFCGKINTFYLSDNNHNSIGRVDIWLWLGFKDQVSSCLQLLPSGHKDIGTTVSLPQTLTYTTNSKYTAVCYIYGALITERVNSPDLCNPCIKIYYCNQTRETYEIMRNLAPLWKETITFADVQLYPNPEYIKDNPPVLTVEMWDQSSKDPTLMGSSLVIPKVRVQPLSNTMEYHLLWFQMNSSTQLLAAFEVIELSKEDIHTHLKKKRRSKLFPKFIEPQTISYRIEVVFWGIRPVNCEKMKGLGRLQAIFQWGPAKIRSTVAPAFNTSPNFKYGLDVVQVDLPDIKAYAPPVVVHIMSPSTYAGFAIDNDLYQYVYNLPSKDQWTTLTSQRKSVVDRAKAKRSSPLAKMPDLIPLMETYASRHSYEVKSPFQKSKRFIRYFTSICSIFLKVFDCVKPFRSRYKVSIEEQSEVDNNDWWSKYDSNKLVKYENELENQPEFQGFNDVFKKFTVKHKKGNTVNMKAMVSIYQWPINEPKVTLQGQDPENGVLKDILPSDKVKVLVRVYCVKAHNLQPCDVNGKSDPFIEIRTPSRVVSDSENYISKQLNPVFGKCFEITATFPVDSVLAVRVMDWDRFTFNDVIGETVIDIENRFYSKFRATCALPSVYTSIGYDTWRDIESPTAILEKLCHMYNIPIPQYIGKTVLVGSKAFEIDHKSKDEEENHERLALLVLHRWSELPVVGHVLVPEHIETRSLFLRKKPGIERGKLEMWVDIFDLSLGPAPPPVDISPRKPESYELRVIIWNTAKVPLVDNSYLVGRKHTDIYVKGWLGDLASTQSTDVHYTSLNGEGNFNWRFIFPFQYIRNENKMVILKSRVLEIGKTEYKVPPLLHLEVWDSDRVTSDDFIGSMVLDLTCMPCGEGTRRRCKMLKPKTAGNYVDMFKVKRVRGWWPFLFYNEGRPVSNAGFLEADIQLLTIEEALVSPAGLGRAEPSGLPPPLRPDFHFKFWLAPLRIITHYLFGVHKGKVILSLLICLLFIFVFVGIYSIPIFVIKRIIGA